MRIGSICSGFAGLDLGVMEVFPDAEPAWFADIDPGASSILSYRFPLIPNLGDITRIDWRDADRKLEVDIITAGFP